MKSTALFTNIALLALFMQSPVLQAMEQTEVPTISKVEAKEEQAFCTICQEDVAPTDSKIITVDCCKKKFHFKCLDPWVYTADNQTNTCPNCRVQFPAETVKTILFKRVAKLVEVGKDPATALKRVCLKDGEYFFANQEELEEVCNRMLAPYKETLLKEINNLHQEKLELRKEKEQLLSLKTFNQYLMQQHLTQIEKLRNRKEELDKRLKFEQAVQKALRSNNAQDAHKIKENLNNIKKLQSPQSISGYLKYYHPRVYGIINIVRNPILYGLAGTGISSLTGFDIKKGFILGSAAAAAIKVLNSSNNFYKEEARQQKHHSSWHSPITGFLRPHALKQSFLGVLTALGAINMALPKDPTTGFIALGSALTTGIIVTNFSRLIVGINQNRSSQRQPANR